MSYVTLQAAAKLSTKTQGDVQHYTFITSCLWKINVTVVNLTQLINYVINQ